MGSGCSTCIDDACEDRRLKNCTDKNCRKFVPDVTRCRVVSVYDGDTITVAAREGRRGMPRLFKVRLAGIDAPEIRGGSGAEKQAAIEARDFLRGNLLNKCVTLSDVKLEKYGRLLATVSHKGNDVSQMLLNRGYAVPYDGGTKPQFAASGYDDALARA